MPRRKRCHGVGFKNHLSLSSQDLNTILSDFEPEINQSSRADMGADLAIILARFRSDQRQRELQIKPNEHLGALRRAAARKRFSNLV